MNYYLFFFILFLINHILHQVAEKIIIILFICLVFILFNIFNNFLTLSYSNRIVSLLRESHLYIDSLLLFFFLSAYSIFHLDCLLNDISENFTKFYRYLPSYLNLNKNKDLFLF